MAGIGKQLRGSGIARPGFSSKHEVTEKQEYRVGKASGGKIGSFERGFSAFKNLDKSPSLGLNKLPKPVLAKMKDGGRAHYAEGSKNWIKGAIKHPGSLRKSLHVKEGQKIPAAKLAAAAKKPGKLGRRARLAETLKGFKK
jgi:hypothetical protein